MQFELEGRQETRPLMYAVNANSVKKAPGEKFVVAYVSCWLTLMDYLDVKAVVELTEYFLVSFPDQARCGLLSGQGQEDPAHCGSG